MTNQGNRNRRTRASAGNPPSAIDWSSAIEESLAARWPDFVNCPQRLELEGPFLLSVLSKPGARIMDAAMGIGCETAFIAHHGFRVTGNEIDPNLRRIACAHIERDGVHVQVTQVDWRSFGKEFGEAAFDYVLVLGNSLCLLRDAAARRRAAAAFRSVTSRAGGVVVDQRNFDYMFEEREKILRGGFRFSGRSMYCGTLVRGRPIAIGRHNVRFAYEDTRSNHTIGHLDMHPLRNGEMLRLFREAGFELTACYSDFTPGYCEQADFYTYVFQ